MGMAFAGSQSWRTLAQHPCRSANRRPAGAVHPTAFRRTVEGETLIISTNHGSTRTIQRQHALEQACLCAQVADRFRGQDTVVLDLTDVTPIVDYFVITTGTNPRQMAAIAEEANRTLKADGAKRMGVEGQESSWILQDYGDVVLHIFTPESRKLYDLEHLWADAQHIDWKSLAPAANR